MTDLCYNCGSCHLPQPCSTALVACAVCRNDGHSWNFCHRGAQSFQTDYRYFALCHNCDAWHLPEPCKNNEVYCKTCNAYGHLPFYCPITPLRRPNATLTATPDDEPGNKRRRMSREVSEAASSGNVTAVSTNVTTSSGNTSAVFSARQMLYNPIMAEEVYALKMSVVKDVLDMVAMHKPQQIFAYLAQAYLGNQGQLQQPIPAPLRLPMPNQIPSWDMGRLMPVHQTPSQLPDNANSCGIRARAQQHEFSQVSEGNPVHQQVQSQNCTQQDQARMEQSWFPGQMSTSSLIPNQIAVSGDLPGALMGFNQDSGHHNQLKTAVSDDRVSNVAPTIEGAPRDTGHEGIQSPYMTDTTHPTGATFGDVTQHIRLANGSPKAAGDKRGGRKGAGIRAPRKSAASKAKQQAQAPVQTQADLVQQSLPSPHEAQAVQQFSEGEAQQPQAGTADT